jgi:hypothetical protein
LARSLRCGSGSARGRPRQRQAGRNRSVVGRQPISAWSGLAMSGLLCWVARSSEAFGASLWLDAAFKSGNDSKC